MEKPTTKKTETEKKTCEYISKTGERCKVCPRNGAFCSKHAKTKSAKESDKAKKESPKETPKEVPKETPKEVPKEVPKETPKEVPKETPKKISKKTSKETPKEVVKEEVSILDSTPDTENIPEEKKPKPKKKSDSKKSKKETGKIFRSADEIIEGGMIHAIKDIEEGKYYHMETGLVFILSETRDEEGRNFDPIFIGYRTERTTPLFPLDLERIEICRLNHWKYQISNLIETENKKEEKDMDDKYDEDMKRIPTNSKGPVEEPPLPDEIQENEDEDV